MASESEQQSTFDPKRRLCPDGSCIGVLGDDGKCTVCGTYDADAATSSATVPLAETVLDQADVDPETAEFDTQESGFDPARRLCSDEACIGVIGPDERCRLCGKPAAP